MLTVPTTRPSKIENYTCLVRHKFQDGSSCITVSASGTFVKIFDVFAELQNDSLLCRQTNPITLHIASYLSLKELSAARGSCKWLYELFGDQKLWNAWIGRLKLKPVVTMNSYVQVRSHCKIRRLETLIPSQKYAQHQSKLCFQIHQTYMTASFLSLNDLNSLGLSCRYIYTLLSKKEAVFMIWKPWIERLRIPFSQKQDPTIAYQQIRNCIVGKIVTCLNQSLSPVPAFTIDEDCTRLMRVVDIKRDHLVSHINLFIQNNLRASVKAILQSLSASPADHSHAFDLLTGDSISLSKITPMD